MDLGAGVLPGARGRALSVPARAGSGPEFLAALAGFEALSLACFGTEGAHRLIGVGDDPLTFVWFLRWWPWAIAHGSDPLVSHAIWSPHGAALGWATSVPALAILAAPITLAAGPIAAFNAITVAAPGLAAACAFRLARALGATAAAAIPAGLIYGFSAYQLGQMLGHLNLDVTFPVPLAAGAAVRLCRPGAARAREAALLALWLALLAGISIELLALVASLGLGLLAVIGLLARPLLGEPAFAPLRRAAVPLAASLAAVALVLSPLLASMARRAHDMPPFVNTPAYYSTDLANLVVPTVMERFDPPGLDRIARRFTGNVTEQGAYLGLPLLLLALAAGGLAWRRGGSRTGRVSGLAALLLLVASLGPALQLGGVGTGIPLPWALLDRLPLLGAALPARISLLVSLAVAVLVADWASRGRSGARVALALACCLPLVPGPYARVRRLAGVPPWFAGPMPPVAAAAGRPRLMVFPFATGAPMLWQAVSGMRFDQAGGYLNYVPLFEQRRPGVVPLVSQAPPWPGFAADVAAYCARDRVDAVVIGPGTPPAVAAGLEALGWPRRAGGEVVVLTPPGAGAGAGGR